MANLIPVIDIKRNFVLTHILSEKFKKEQPTSQELESAYYKTKRELSNQNETEIDIQFKEIRPPSHQTLYDSLKWTLENIKFSDMGPCPRMCEIHPYFTTGSIEYTSKLVKEFQEGYFQLNQSQEEESNFLGMIRKIESMGKNGLFLRNNAPIILVPGGTRRNIYNLESKAKGLPQCSILKYEIDDGNGRALSYAMQGLTSTSCFIGRAQPQTL
ncbi:MAG: hypothetical protein ABIH59_02700 [archaeon]